MHYRLCIRMMLAATGLAWCNAVMAKTSAAGDFDESVRYSELVINSRINDFKANTTAAGFGVFDDQGRIIATPNNAKSNLDYVPGLVAKAIIEAVDYYKDRSDVDVKSWFYAVQYYANTYDITSGGKEGMSFDDLNAVKLYFKLQELSAGGYFADSPNYTNAATLSTANRRFADALNGIKKANANYVIRKSTLADAAGGWWHKASYTDQMWCDGLYMGPALLAQMANEYTDYAAITTNDWDLITRQFTISWNYLWNNQVQLLYHAFTAAPGGAAAAYWKGISAKKGAEVYHSAEFWGRAEAWYLLALVDVLEQMGKAGLTGTDNYHTLHGYLQKLAAGIAAKQDAETGCWYQLLNHDDSYVAQSYNSSYSYTSSPVRNYLESSCTAIFTAAYLKGMRLGLFDHDYTPLAKKAYRGFVENFMIADGKGGVHLVGCCKSAGLGGYNYRDGSANYYLMGKDTKPTSTQGNDFYTEGKVLGGFIMAATEYERLNDATTDNQPADDTKLEAESADYANCKLIDDGKYSGGKALELTDGNAKINFTYNAVEGGKYTVYLGYDGLYGAKVINLEVNGNTTAIQGTDKQEELNAGNFIMNEGNNTIVITPGWTWFRIDYIRIESNTSTLQFDIAQAPVDTNAADCAKTLYGFLHDNFGKKTISGIMTGDMSSANGDVTQHDDVKAVYQASGKYPALVGFDFMNATGTHEAETWYKDYTRSAVELAKDTWRRGGIPAFTWHWRDPSRSSDDFYSEKCKVKISSALNADGTWNTSSGLYTNIIKDIDTIADYFIELQNAGVACIFRPLHEASGAWFWWGASGAQPYVRLYQLIVDEMTKVKGVHNVIWVWNPCYVDDTAWNPGDAYYDVVSIDIYNNAYDYSSNYAAFDKLKTNTAGKKIIALSENGPIPDIDKEFEEGAVWSWWMPWYQTWDGKFVDKTSNAEWAKCMTDPRVITLEDLSAGWASYTGIQTLDNGTISPSDHLYDLSGRQWSNGQMRMGIYIKGGKKIVVK